jgi:hypothetical protein
MTTFANSQHFAGFKPHALASGVDLNPDNALVDPQGRVIGYVSTGGILGPVRHELPAGSIIFRFGSSRVQPPDLLRGAWWIERASFEKLLSFANTHGISIGLSVRLLCLVPPEWSDLGRLVRARVARPLLCYRGLGNSVVVRKSDGLGSVRLPHANDIAARRTHQLFIPGLDQVGPSSLTLEEGWTFDPKKADQGWIYL